MSILVLYSDTSHDRAALDHALAEAALRSTDVTVLNGPAEAAPQDLLEQALQIATERGIAVSVDRDHDDRQPVEHALAATQRNGVDLLVLGLPHRSPVGKLLLGSVEQRILLDAVVPVLTDRNQS